MRNIQLGQHENTDTIFFAYKQKKFKQFLLISKNFLQDWYSTEAGKL
jgi:hypothetical protein